MISSFITSRKGQAFIKTYTLDQLMTWPSYMTMIMIKTPMIIVHLLEPQEWIHLTLIYVGIKRSGFKGVVSQD
jgi:hypothetical protein